MGGEHAAGIFLDRDGVINRLITERGPRETPLRPEEFTLLPGVQETLALFRRLHIPLVVVTNQPNVAKGKTSWAQHHAIEARMHTLLGDDARVDAIYTCFHHPDQAQVVIPDLWRTCTCRKPQPGLLLQAASDLHLDLRQSVLVGDSTTDIAAGRTVGCRTVRILGPGEEMQHPPADAVASSLLDATGIVLNFFRMALPPVVSDSSSRLRP